MCFIFAFLRGCHVEGLLTLTALSCISRKDCFLQTCHFPNLPILILAIFRTCYAFDAFDARIFHVFFAHAYFFFAIVCVYVYLCEFFFFHVQERLPVITARKLSERAFQCKPAELTMASWGLAVLGEVGAMREGVIERKYTKRMCP